MKFGAVLRDSAADLPDTEDLFLKYKQLKKSIKRMHSTNQHTPHHSNSESDEQHKDNANEAGPSTKRAKHNDNEEPKEEEDDTTNAAVFLLDPELEAEFLRVITADVMELNDRYIEKEEDNVIKFSQLEDAAEAASTPETRAVLYRAFVDLHGELLMLFHWSVLAYTGLVKILKKHRKRTGAPLHAPHLENLLSQPFCSVEVTCDMVRKAEEWVSKLAKDLNVAPPPAVPLPEGLLVKSSGVAAGGVGVGGLVHNNSVNGNLNNGTSETLTSPEEEKAKVLEAVAAAVAVAEAAEAKAAQEAAKTSAVTASDGTDDAEKNTGGVEEKKEEEKEKKRAGSATAVAVAATAAAQENLALRRIRAALNVWHQLQSNVSTPSTMIAAGVQASGAGAGVGAAMVQAASLTTSSIA
jgi:hypothetical protein